MFAIVVLVIIFIILILIERCKKKKKVNIIAKQHLRMVIILQLGINHDSVSIK